MHPGADEAVSLIESGRADFTTFNSVVFNEYLQQHPDANLKVAFVIPDVVDTYAVPIKKGETASSAVLICTREAPASSRISR